MTPAERAYYERRAAEYDDWYLGTGLFAARERPGWHEEVSALCSLVRKLPANKILDLACGTGFLTQHAPGRVIGLDQSPGMLEIARSRLRDGDVVLGDALRLPFEAGVFDCAIAGHFFGHLSYFDRERFLKEARRVSARLLVVDAALRPDIPADGMQERVLRDGSRHSVYKRYFTPAQLAGELGGGEVLYAGRWFVVVLAGESAIEG